jgi:hypothetical protein
VTWLSGVLTLREASELAQGLCRLLRAPASVVSLQWRARLTAGGVRVWQQCMDRKYLTTIVVFIQVAAFLAENRQQKHPDQ